MEEREGGKLSLTGGRGEAERGMTRLGEWWFLDGGDGISILDRLFLGDETT